MSRLIDRDKAIEAIAEHLMGEAVLEYSDASDNIEDWKEIGEAILENIPPAEAVPKGSDEASLAYAEGWKNGEEAERSRKPKREWASVLAELHEQFFALEKEIRKASAEMSAIIREYVDGLKDEPQTKEPKTILEELLERQTKEDIRNMKERLRKAVEDEPQTETEIAKEIVHTMINDAVIAEDVYPDLRQKMHDAVDEYEPQTCFNCKHNVVKHTFDHACGGCINMDSYEREDEQSGKE